MNKSFTLIEILVVIVVIGVLSAFILVGMSSITSSANIAKSKAFLNSMDNSLLLARVSEWKLDDRPTIAPFVTSDSWGINTGTLMDVDGSCSTTKCPQLVTSGCPSGSCLSFDGVDDYVDCGNNSSLQIRDSITLGAWIKTSSQGTIVPVSKAGNSSANRNYMLYKASNGKGQFYLYISDVSKYASYEQADIDDNNWHYLVGTYNGSIVKIYVDGVVGSTTTSTTGQIDNDSVNFLIGTGYISSYFNGSIDDVRVYNTAISTSQIQENYYLGINKLFKNKGIGSGEYSLRISQLKEVLTKY